MSAPDPTADCERVQLRLCEAALAGRDADAGERSHARGCESCAAYASLLERLDRELAPASLTPLSPALLAVCRSRAERALRARELPCGFGRDVARALGLGLLALPLVALWSTLVVRWTTAALAPLVPDMLLAWLGLVYFGSLALGLGLAYGAIPIAIALARGRRGAPRPA
jgi:hypothetical protein